MRARLSVWSLTAALSGWLPVAAFAQEMPSSGEDWMRPAKGVLRAPMVIYLEDGLADRSVYLLVKAVHGEERFLIVTASGAFEVRAPDFRKPEEVALRWIPEIRVREAAIGDRLQVEFDTGTPWLERAMYRVIGDDTRHAIHIYITLDDHERQISIAR